MKRKMHVTASNCEFFLNITDTPRWVLAKDWAWDKLCSWSRGWLGGHGLPDVFWNIPVGRARWDHHDPEEPWLINSVANLMCDLEGWVLSLGDDPRVRDEPDLAVRIPISEEVARMLDPEYVENHWVDDDAAEVTFDKGGEG